MPFHVPLSAVPILRDPPFVVAMLLLGAALGRRTLRTVRAPVSELSRLEYGVVCAALGSGLLQYVAFSLGVAGRLTPPNLRLAFAVVALLLVADLWAVVRASVRALGEVGRRRGGWPGSWSFWLLVALAPALIVAFLQTLTPATDIDGISYHLGVPRRWLATGRMEYVPTMFMAQLPLGQEMLYTSVLAMWSEGAARLIHYGYGLLTLIGLISVTRRLSRPNVGTAAGAVLMVGFPTLRILELSTWAYTELGIACQLMAGVIAWLAWRRSRSTGWLIAAFLCGGLALTYKLTTGFFVIGMALLTAAHEWRRGPVRAIGLSGGGFVLSVAVLSPWLVRAWSLTGNPVYPFLSNVFPTRDWSPEASRMFAIYYHYRVWGTGRLLRGLSEGERLSLVIAVLLVVAAVTAIYVWRVRDADLRAVVLLAGLMTAALISNSGLYGRFFVPIIPLWLAAMAPAAAMRWQGRRAGAVLLLFTAAGSVLYLRLSGPTAGEAAAFAFGRGGREAYLNRNVAAYPLAKYANGALPRGSLILVAGSAPQYYFDAPLIFPDFVRMRTDSWENFQADLRRNGVTHILLSRRFYDDAPPGIGAPDKVHGVRRAVAERGTLLAQTEYDLLYALRPVK